MMFTDILSCLLLTFVVIVEGAAVSLRDNGQGQVTLPLLSPNTMSRATNLSIKRDGWLYGAPVVGGGPSPAGKLGLARVKSDTVIENADAYYESSRISMDRTAVESAIRANGGLKTVSDYTTVLYTNQWNNSVPGGPEAGILTNFTQDLQFSMERLSLNPYSLRLVKKTEPLPFFVDASIVKNLSGTTLSALQSSGKLFLADHSYQLRYPKNPYYGAACSALFYISPSTNDFLPLAIKTNVGTNLTYTPLDTVNDWLLAKIMFNANDFFHAEVYHLAASHSVGDAVLLAAQRTLSVDHPVMALLDRLMVGAYAIRPVGAQYLFNPGGSFDQIFHTNSTGAIQYINENYPTISAYQSHYLEADLTNRGLLKSKGPVFKSFPWYEDAKAIHDTIQTFMASFVKTYYKSSTDMLNDNELQSFFIEASNSANISDFPCSTTPNRCTNLTVLTTTLTHFAYLTSVGHHTLNTGTLARALGTLPFHPGALWSPLPTTKGVKDLLPFLPPMNKALSQIDLTANFNRPQYASQNRTLAHAYSDATFLSRFKPAIATAAETYHAAMMKLSGSIRGRKFDEKGLSQGMPFKYTCLDPAVIPWFFAI